MRSEPNLPARQRHKRVETAGVYPLAPAAGRGNSLPLRFSEKHPARSGEPPAHLVPRTIGAEKNCRPDRTNTLTQFAYPGQPVQSKTKRGSLS